MTHLRVMSYNIWEGGHGREAALLAVIRAADPDLLLMQEVVDEGSAAHLAEALGMALAFAPSNARTRNIALLSRWPILRASSFHPFPLLRTLLLATVGGPDGAPLHCFGLHLGLIHDLWRRYELAVILARLAAWRRRYPAPRALLAGDFNSVAAGDRVALRGLSPLLRAVLALQFAPWPRYALARVTRAGWRDCFRALHPRADGFTLPAEAPAVRLDYCFADAGLAPALRHCAPLDSPAARRASDHLPLVAEFRWDE